MHNHDYQIAVAYHLHDADARNYPDYNAPLYQQKHPPYYQHRRCHCEYGIQIQGTYILHILVASHQLLSQHKLPLTFDKTIPFPKYCRRIRFLLFLLLHSVFCLERILTSALHYNFVYSRYHLLKNISCYFITCEWGS